MNGSTYGPRPGLAFVLVAIVLAGLVWSDQIETFIHSLPWNVAVIVIGAVAVALGIMGAAAMFWRSR